MREPGTRDVHGADTYGSSLGNRPNEDLLSTQSAVTGLVTTADSARDSTPPSLPSANFALPTLPEAGSIAPFSPGTVGRPASATAPAYSAETHRPSSAPLFPASPPSFTSAARPPSTRNIIVAAGDDAQIITLTQVLAALTQRAPTGISVHTCCSMTRAVRPAVPCIQWAQSFQLVTHLAGCADVCRVEPRAGACAAAPYTKL